MNQNDFRRMRNGKHIPTEYYSDQPYLVKADDGAWVCTVTTGPGHEGEKGQHIIILRSRDMGETWDDISDIEPSDAPESAYSVLLKAPSGRIFCFYNYNIEDLRVMRTHLTAGFPHGEWARVDSQGHFFFKYSDDSGKTWSAERIEIPIRTTEIDRRNLYGGRIKMFWNVGKAFIRENSVYVPLHKIGALGECGFRASEGVLLCSTNLLSVNDPADAVWETLPDGDIGLRTPVGGGLVSEEQSACVLSDGTIYCVYRSVDGHPVDVYSYDGGHTFTEPRYKQYADGRPIKHPRAANFVWKCNNGKYLYWFHNHGGKDYTGRNPVWICGGEEYDTPSGRRIRWSQPEILLYDENANTRMSYPDLLEDGGHYFLTETQKVTARSHEIDPSFLEKLWAQFENRSVARERLLLDAETEAQTVIMPRLSPLDSANPALTRPMVNGLTLEIRFVLHDFAPYQPIFSSLDADNRGLSVRVSDSGTIEFQMGDGKRWFRWRTTPGLFELEREQVLSVIVDADAGILSFVVNGAFDDGGKYKQYGWARFSRNFGDVSGAAQAVLGGSTAEVKHIRIYDRALMVSECIGNARADSDPMK